MEISISAYWNRYNRIIAHIVFWAIVLLFYLGLFFSGEDQADKLRQFIVFYLPLTIGTAYFTNYLLIPRYLLQGHYKRFLLFFVYTVISVSFLFTIVTLGLFVYYNADQELKTDVLPQEVYNFKLLGVSLLMVVFAAMAIRLLRYWIKSEKSNLLLKQQQTETELQLIKSQIHPHFLFNTLNNLYALTLKKSDAAPEVVMKLSSLLDYMLFECAKQQQVSLDQEIEQLENFIALEKLRYGDRVEVQFNIAGITTGKKIAPLVLLTFLENSFKHGVGNKLDEAWVHFDLEVNNRQLTMMLENSKRLEPAKHRNGLGLQNVKRHLSLIYADRHQLKIEDKAESFSVTLKIDFIPS
ncbi:histidine kinase [Limibacter armeniacum]|uniref:sensor histidine kinase n=1 Tax=Limibacter armeniacum TaxID=466084 RepID=UPI002FE6B6CC